MGNSAPYIKKIGDVVVEDNNHVASLFNAPSTIDGYYKAEVNHDFPQYAH